MFQEIKSEDVIQAIKALIKEDNLRQTDYAVWWRGHFISPSAVISKHYELIGNPINRRSINTDQVQSALLNLGFPIIDLSRKDDFFTEKELISFQNLLERKDYNSEDPVDINIGSFLRETIWTKTKIWAEKLGELGWVVVSAKRLWNTRHQKKGFQTYFSYF